MKINISLIDYYVGIIISKKTIISKRYITILTYLNSLSKMLSGWLAGEEKRKSI